MTFEGPFQSKLSYDSKTQRNVFVCNRNCFSEETKAFSEETKAFARIICMSAIFIFEQQEFIRNYKKDITLKNAGVTSQ